MSPGATFERVYTELRRMLAEGELPPGSPIEPAAVGRQIASSITPVRDALHRLTGERLVEAPNHNGFRVPLITEAELRDLYQWHAQLLILAARQIRPSQAAVEATGPSLGEEPASAMTTLFGWIADASGNLEHVHAVHVLSDRLAAFRRIEPAVLGDLAGELQAFRDLYRSGAAAKLVAALDRYSRRRLRAVPALLAARHGRRHV